ncbi:MAG: M16 family metallopeptidase [Bdellovibrionota bacterium]
MSKRMALAMGAAIMGIGTSATAHADWTVVNEQNPGAVLARIQVILRAGSAVDGAAAGLANFTARALLRGTKTKPFKDLNTKLEALGGSLNVSVDQSQSVFSGVVLTKNLEPFLDLVAEILSEPQFDNLEMQILQKQIQGEIRADLQDPDHVASRAAWKAMFPGTALENPPAGTVASVGQVTAAMARQFFQTYYGRSNMVVGFSSVLSDADAAQKLMVKFSPVSASAASAAALPSASFSGRHVVIVDRPGLTTTPMYLVGSGLSDGDADLPILETGNFVFGGDFTSRLMQEIRAKLGYTYGIYSGYSQLIGPKAQPGFFSIYLFPSADASVAAAKRALEMLDDYAKSGITSDDLERAKQSLGNSYPFRVDTAEKRLAQKVRTALTGRVAMSTDQFRAFQGTLTTELVNQKIHAHTDSLDLLIAIVGDASKLKPALSSLPFVSSVQTIDIQP